MSSSEPQMFHVVFSEGIRTTVNKEGKRLSCSTKIERDIPFQPRVGDEFLIDGEYLNSDYIAFDVDKQCFHVCFEDRGEMDYDRALDEIRERLAFGWEAEHLHPRFPKEDVFGDTGPVPCKGQECDGDCDDLSCDADK